MKSFAKPIALFACLSILSCEKESHTIDKEQEFNKPFKATLDEHVILKNNESQVLFQIKNISDDRCAMHIECSDPGEATVRIEVSNNSNSKAETLLHLGLLNGEMKSSDSIRVQLDDRFYMISLQGVNPHPIEGKDETQTAQMLIKPQ